MFYDFVTIRLHWVTFLKTRWVSFLFSKNAMNLPLSFHFFSNAIFFSSSVGSVWIPFPFSFISLVDGGDIELDPPADERITTPFVKGFEVIVVAVVDKVDLGNEVGSCVLITFPATFPPSESFDEPTPFSPLTPLYE